MAYVVVAFRAGVPKDPETASAVPLEVPVPDVKLQEVLSVADQLMAELLPGAMEDGLAKRVTTGAAVPGGGVTVEPPRLPPLQAVRPKADKSIARETPEYWILARLVLVFVIVLLTPYLQAPLCDQTT
jgi:hypothetical protein